MNTLFCILNSAFILYKISRLRCMYKAKMFAQWDMNEATSHTNNRCQGYQYDVVLTTEDWHHVVVYLLVHGSVEENLLVIQAARTTPCHRSFKSIFEYYKILQFQNLNDEISIWFRSFFILKNVSSIYPQFFL